MIKRLNMISLKSSLFINIFSWLILCYSIKKLVFLSCLAGNIFLFSLFVKIPMSNSKLVYSTDTTLSNLEESVATKRVRASQQKVRLHLDRKGGGKIVTLVKGLKEPREKIMNITKELKKKCGTGGTVKNGEILIQGNQRNVIQKILLKKGYDVKLSGG